MSGQQRVSIPSSPSHRLPKRSPTPLPPSPSHYSTIDDEKQRFANLSPKRSLNLHGLGNYNLSSKPPISLRNRPLPPVPPPRKSQLSSFTQQNREDQVASSRSGSILSDRETLVLGSYENDVCAKSDTETNSVSSIYEQISPKKLTKSSLIVKTSKLQHHHQQVNSTNNNSHNNDKREIPAPATTSGFSMAELATRFLEENVRNCIKPRIFPMESASSFNERSSTPYIFAASSDTTTTQIHLQQRRLIFAPSLVMDRFLASKTALVSKTRSLTSSLGTFSQYNLQHFHGTKMSSSNAIGSCTSNGNTSVVVGGSTAAITSENTSPAKKSSGMSSQNGTRSDFASVLRKWSAPIPPTLSRKLGRTSESPLGKVKVMLRVCDNADEVSSSSTSGILGLDKRRKQVTLIDPGGATPSGITPEERRVGISAPKMFAFDGIFGEDDDQGEICAASAAELVASVVGGEDGCFVSLGYCSSGKRQTMFGKPANQKMGTVPTAISWLFKSILEQKQKTGSRFSVRVSAVEVTGGSGHEVINDLLLPFVNDGDDPPGALLENTSSVSTTNSKGISAPVLNSVSEVRAPNPETAGFFLDSALDSMNNKEEPVGHFVFTLHVYQYSVDKNGKGVAGGRSRLHCVMLGNGSPSISVLGGLLLAVLNGQRHLPSSNHSKLGAILRECLGSLTCRAVVMIHVSNVHARYAETLAALQLGARVHRLRRSRRLKMGSVGSGNGSGGSSGGSGEDTRNAIGVNNQVGEGETSLSSDIDPSSSEQSCDTVIYLGPSIDEATDGEHPPVYLPSLETSPGENEAKIIPSKCPLLNGPSGLPPKTKSPKPKSSSKMTSDGNFSSQNGKSEEQWVDGPKVTKYRQLNGNNSSGSSGVIGSGSSVQNCTPSPAKKKGETWIDGPAARVQHQASNFPSPKKTIPQQARNGSGMRSNGNHPSNGRASCDLANCPTVCINATKAEMIQKWISNQTPVTSDLFDESPLHNNILDSIYNGQHEKNASLQNGLSLGGGLNNLSLTINAQQFSQTLNGQQISCCTKSHNPNEFTNIYSCHCLNRENNFTGPTQLHTEPEYKALTVFKTCDDASTEDDHQSLCNGYDFEFIEVVEPEIPVPTRDAWLQVTEEDIALAYLEENPLPESDQNFEMSPESYFSRGRSSSFSEISSCTSHNSLPKLEKADDHPLRVLSQECLTVVSTFADSMSISGGDMERFWPRLSFPSDLETSQDIGMCHGLCKNLTGPKVSPPSNTHTLSSKLEQMSTQNNKPPSSLLLRELPVLSDDSIFKVPIVMQQPQKSAKLSRLSAVSSKKYISGKESSDTENESMKIPPMDIIDTTPITSSCHLPIENTTTQVQSITVALPLRSNQETPMESNTPSPPRPVCEHNHTLQDIQLHGHGLLLSSIGSGGSIQSSPSRSTLTPPSSTSPVTPIKLPDVTKSPSKSKSRKISKFFRTRSKSPKTAGATSSSESGKSSMSSDAKHSSSSSSCSSGISAPPVITSKPKSHSSPKHMSPSRHQSPSKKQSSRKNSCFSTSTNSSADYHFTCDSVLPMFLPPNPNQHKKIGSGSVDISGNGVLITDLGLVKSK